MGKVQAFMAEAMQPGVLDKRKRNASRSAWH